MNSKFRVLTFILFLIAVIPSVNGQSFAVDGRVVDEFGNSVADANVQLISSCNDCKYLTTFSFISNEDGFFIIDPPIGMPSEIKFMIFAPAAENSWNPFSGFEPRLAEFLNLKPVTVKIKNSKIIHLNDLKPTLSYKKVELNLSELFGVEKEKILEYAEFITVKIISPKGNLFNTIKVPSEAVKNNSAGLTLALPKGFAWSLQFAIKVDISKTILKNLTVK